MQVPNEVTSSLPSRLTKSERLPNLIYKFVESMQRSNGEKTLKATLRL